MSPPCRGQIGLGTPPPSALWSYFCPIPNHTTLSLSVSLSLLGVGCTPFSYWFPGDNIETEILTCAWYLCSKYFLLSCCFCFNFVSMSSIFFHREVLNFNVVKIVAFHFMAYGFLSHAHVDRLELPHGTTRYSFFLYPTKVQHKA